MCGITGILNFDKRFVQESVLRKMTDSLSHRGPDNGESWVYKNVGLGHRRLSIIDLKTGDQPMSDISEKIWITYNGELYNFLELKKILLSLGYKFRTNSDTEVIINSYLEWGEECLKKFRGMFAFGIVDLRKRLLFLARDQLGIKPLVYWKSDRTFFFSSELQTFKYTDEKIPPIDIQAVDQYLMFQYIPAPKTIYQGIKKLLPAHSLTVSFDGEVSKPLKYWDIEFKPDHSLNESEWLEALDEILLDSVRKHLISDVPLGAFLSGGIDSTLIVKYMTEILNKPVKTFSIGFEDDDFNETKYSEIVAKKYGTEHYIEIVKSNALEILPELVDHYGEPFGDSSAIPTYYLSKMARKYVPVVLSGDGGDEAFGGYNTYIGWQSWLLFHKTPKWKKFLYPFVSAVNRERYPKREPKIENWLRQINLISQKEKRKIWRREFQISLENPENIFGQESSKIENYSNVNKAQFLDIKTYLPYDILTKVDVASMMNSLEVRTPLVDKKIFEFAARIPEKFNFFKNPEGDFEGKMLLKKILMKDYSKSFLHRRKMGFGIPADKWFGSVENRNIDIYDRLVNKHSNISELFYPDQIEKMINNSNYNLTWLLLFLEEWLSKNK